MFWNVCVGQPGSVHDAGQFAVSSFAAQLSTRQILSMPVIRLRRMDIRPYLIGDITYPSRPYLLKNFKFGNEAMVDHNRYMVFPILFLIYKVQKFTCLLCSLLKLCCDLPMFDSSVNSGRVVIEQAFGALKNRWRILKGFNMSVDKAVLVTLACCVLHNYCEVHRQRIPVPADERLQRDPYVGFHVGRMQLPSEGLPAKLVDTISRHVMNHTIVKPSGKFYCHCG